jgi:hypothetical protein
LYVRRSDGDTDESRVPQSEEQRVGAVRRWLHGHPKTTASEDRSEERVPEGDRE